jgi:hypothetical protein
MIAVCLEPVIDGTKDSGVLRKKRLGGRALLRTWYRRPTAFEVLNGSLVLSGGRSWDAQVQERGNSETEQVGKCMSNDRPAIRADLLT